MKLQNALRPHLGALLWAAAVLWLTGCAAPTPARVGPPRNFQAEVVAEFDRSLSGWNSGNLDAFLAIYADDATFALSDNFLQGRAAIRQYYAPQFVPGANRGILTLDQFNVEVLSMDVVLVRAIYQTKQGLDVIRGTATFILHHFVNHWRIIHDHTT